MTFGNMGSRFRGNDGIGAGNDNTGMELAPDGSTVHPLLRTPHASLARFELAAGAVAAAVMHRTVEELWYVLAGRGELWRRQGDQEEVIELRAGVSLSIPCGAHFQFRAGDETLVVLGVTMPPWPGEDEAVHVKGPWEPRT